MSDISNTLQIYNTLNRKKEAFVPLHSPRVGMYVCGPTVYNDVHLGNCRTFISFDLVYRYLRFSGYNVRYVRNITDAGHLEGDRDEGEDKFAKRARLEQLEPMEIVQKYTIGFHEVMQRFNNLPPSIEPTATGHIIEQIEMTKSILAAGLAYEVNGTVYFDVEKFSQTEHYGALSNRKIEELFEHTRALSGQDEKKGRLDFALWIKAKPEHLMQWPSPWGNGFPGWHIECSAMSRKYLGDEFDIHGGGMDLIATHHTNEVAQSKACGIKNPVRYWMHTNMLTVNGVRMSKSAGNGFLPEELFSGNHQLLDKGYDPMVVRFFMLQTHYRSTLDFSNEALQASEKGFHRLMAAVNLLNNLNPSEKNDVDVKEWEMRFYAAMDDDFNSPVLIAHLFDLVRIVNSLHEGRLQIDAGNLGRLKKLISGFVFDVLGLKTNAGENEKTTDAFNASMRLLNSIRMQARLNKDFATSDKIRDELIAGGIKIKDTREGMEWSID